MNRPSSSSASAWQALGAAALFVTLGAWLAAALTVSVLAAARALGGPVHDYLEAAGVAKVMRRCLLAVAIPFLIVFLRRAGWGGWPDCGFSSDDPDGAWRSRRAGLARGFLLGILTMGAIGAVVTLAGIHRLYSELTPAAQAARIAGFLASALAVGLFEETLMRGILFRVLARLWRAWPAAILSSVIFSAAHFVEPAAGSLCGGSFLGNIQSVFLSTLSEFWKQPGLGLRFLNLALLGIVLCAFVIRTKTIWFSVGAHAGWVWMIKAHGLITLFYPPAPLVRWLGKRNDFTDSILATAMLAGLLALAARADAGRPRRHLGRRWRLDPRRYDRIARWLDAETDRNGPIGGRVLKQEGGSRVAARAGFVWKQRCPPRGWRGWRFHFRPSRARRAFLLGRRLAGAGFPTPLPAAWCDERRAGLRRAEHLITAELTEAEPLTDWLRRRSADPAESRSALAAYGRLAAAFHRAGYFNRDLKHENVMIARSDPGRLWVVDLDGVRRRPWLTRRRAARDLRRIGLSLAAEGRAGPVETAAFFEAYNAAAPARLRRATFPV